MRWLRAPEPRRVWGQRAGIRVLHASASDQELVALVRQRDEGAFAALYDRYGRLAFAVALRLLRDSARAEEVVQDAFLKLWQLPGSYTPERGRFQAWFLSVVHHRAVDVLRTMGGERGRLTDATDGMLAAALPDPAPAVEEQVVQANERHTVVHALNELPEAQREAISLAYFDGLSQSEIAARLGQPLGTIKTRIRTGMQRLRVTLASAGVGIGGL